MMHLCIVALLIEMAADRMMRIIVAICLVGLDAIGKILMWMMVVMMMMGHSIHIIVG